MLPSPTKGSTCGSDLVTATVSTDMEAQHHGAALQLAESGSGPCPPLPSSAVVLRRSGSECAGISSFVDPGPVELPEPPSDDRVPSPAAPTPVPARDTALYTKKPRVFRANPKIHIEQSKRFAKGVLEDYNKRKKIKFELLDVVPSISMPELNRFYTHMNFTARPKKEGSQEQLFFAEIYHCGRRPAKSSFDVTCCEPLGPDSTESCEYKQASSLSAETNNTIEIYVICDASPKVNVKNYSVYGQVIVRVNAAGSRFLKHDASAERKNVDFAHCFACTERILHPKGQKYIAGHCTIPNIYGSPCY